MPSVDQTTTPTSATLSFTEEKSLPLPSLEDLLLERREKSEESPRGQDLSTQLSTRGSQVSSWTPPHIYHLPQSWPSSCQALHSPSSRSNGADDCTSTKQSFTLSASPRSFTAMTAHCTIEVPFQLNGNLPRSGLSRGRSDSRDSARSSGSAPFFSPMPSITSPPAEARREASGSTIGNAASSDQSSHTSHSARGSLWSNSQTSRYASWSTHASTSMTTASNSRDWNYESTGPDVHGDEDFDTHYGLGISSEAQTNLGIGKMQSRAPIRSYAGCTKVSSSSSSSSMEPSIRSPEGDRWAHHRSSSCARNGSLTIMSPLLPQQMPSSPSNEGNIRHADLSAMPVPASERPSLGRIVSEPGATDGTISASSISATFTVSMLPPHAILPRINSRSRACSEASGAHRRQASQLSCEHSLSFFSDDSHSTTSSSPSPRDGSLRRGARDRTPSSVSASKSLSLKGSISLKSLTASSSGYSSETSQPVHKQSRKDSVRDSDEAEEVLHAFPGLFVKETTQRFWQGPSRMTSAIGSSVLSLDLSSLGMDVAQEWSLDDSSKVGDAIKLVEGGDGIVIEAKERALKSFRQQMGKSITHLLLSGCTDPSMDTFLHEALPTVADSLVVLDVSFTGLASLPPTLAACSKLEELNVTGLRQGSSPLPACVGKLSRLRVLVADDVGMASLPLCVSHLTELKTLSIRYNQLMHLPSWLCHLAKLERLYLAGNPFQGVWMQILSSIFPQQVAPPMPSTPAGSSSANVSPAASPASANSCFAQPSADDYGFTHDEPLRTHRPTLPRTRSENDVQRKLFPMVSPVRIVSGLEPMPAAPPSLEETSGDACSRADVKGVEAQPHRKGLLDRDATVKAKPSDGDGRWAFLRKVTRKSSQPNGLKASMTSPSANEHLSPASLRGSDSKMLPWINMAMHSSTSTRRAGLNSVEGSLYSTDMPQSGRSKLMAAFEPKLNSTAIRQDSSSSATNEPSVTRGGAESNRRSFFCRERALISSCGTPHLCTSTSSSSKPAGEDGLEWRAKMHGLMCYLRDLDDLAPLAAARRRGMEKSLSSSSVAGHEDAGEASSLTQMPLSATGQAMAGLHSSIRRRPSEMLLGLASRTAAPTEIKDDSRRRCRIIAEIISSEESYLRGLRELCEIYVHSARLPDDKTGRPILSPHEHRAIFGNVEGLVQFHSYAFLPCLKEAARGVLSAESMPDGDNEADCRVTAQAAEAVARVFIQHSGWFRMYSAYINGCDEAQSRIAAYLSHAPTSSATAALRSAATATVGVGVGDAGYDAAAGKNCGVAGTTLSAGQRKRFKAFMKRCRADARHSQLSIESYLLLPVQRIPRYELLLRDLARSTAPQLLEDPSGLSNALTEISGIAASVNESKRQSEQDRKLLAWQGRIRTRERQMPLMLVQPHRRLLRDGILQLRRVVARAQAFEARGHVDCGEAACDGSLSVDLKHVWCLQQQIVGQRVMVLLCNDVCVLATDSQVESGVDGGGVVGAVSGGRRPLDVFSVLRFPPSSPVRGDSPRCQIFGQSYLRVVDQQRVYYFTASSRCEAVSWCDAINAVAADQ